MIQWPAELVQDVVFDHDAAFRAEWAIDEVLARLDAAAANRWRVFQDSVACWCEGPFAEHLKAEVGASVGEAADLAERLRVVRSRLRDARDRALVQQVRLEVARSDWLASQASSQPAPSSVTGRG